MTVSRRLEELHHRVAYATSSIGNAAAAVATVDELPDDERLELEGHLDDALAALRRAGNQLKAELEIRESIEAER